MRLLGLAIALVLAMSACSHDAEPEAEEESAAGSMERTEPFEAPAGVRLTDTGTQVGTGAPLTVVHRSGSSASAVVVTLTAFERGRSEDLAFFSSDTEVEDIVPYYARFEVANAGPAGLGGASLPVTVLTAEERIPATEVVGDFASCRPRALPDSFLTGTSARLCLVYLLPRTAVVEAIEVATGQGDDMVGWTP